MLYFGGDGKERERLTIIILCESHWEIPLHFLNASLKFENKIRQMHRCKLQNEQKCTTIKSHVFKTSDPDM